MSQLISGQAYSLKEIFRGENDKVIIPDLQRDYCWGNPISSENNSSLVESFIESILNLEKSSDITMGLIYGYYDKLMPYHLQLCDGQQRLTTLFLIVGELNRIAGDNRYKEILISNFELNDDDNEPHLLYGIRESSLYFLSDLTIHYFLNPKLSLKDLEKERWFLNSYKTDPTITSILMALDTIEDKFSNVKDICTLGDFVIEHLKFLFYDMSNRQNGEETFVVINTTGEPLSTNENLKPVIILANPGYKRIEIGSDNTSIEHDTASDWENMETWFWQKRRKNDSDTSTEGMIAFLHCVRILESATEEEWYKNYETIDNKFPDSIKMQTIWDWFCAYKRIYELSYDRLCNDKIEYPSSSSHYTQKDLYSLLPTMTYCNRFKDASDEDIQRVYHLFSNMSKYRNVYRSSKGEPINVPAFRTCHIIEQIDSMDILSLLDIQSFDITEERTKLFFIKNYSEDADERIRIEELFAKAEKMSIYEGQIATLVNWSKGSKEELNRIYCKIDSFWGQEHMQNTVRRALLAYGINGYPMSTGTANHTLCRGTEWRTLFEKKGDQILGFINEGDPDSIIEKYKNPNSQYYPLINNPELIKFSQDQRIRIHAQGVIELMSKTKASANFLIFHNGVEFAKDMVDMKKNWNGFWVWSDENEHISVFYTMSLRHNLTLDMQIIENGYRIVAWLNRRPEKKTVDPSILKEIGFIDNDNNWTYPIITSTEVAKETFIQITESLSLKMNKND